MHGNYIWYFIFEVGFDQEIIASIENIAFKFVVGSEEGANLLAQVNISGLRAATDNR